MQKFPLDTYKNLARQIKTGQHSALIFDIQELPIIPQSVIDRGKSALTCYIGFIIIFVGASLCSIPFLVESFSLAELCFYGIFFSAFAYGSFALYQAYKAIELYEGLGVSPAFLNKVIEKSQLLKGNVTTVTPITHRNEVEIGYTFTLHLTKHLTGTFYASAQHRLPSGSQVTVIYYDDSLHTLLIPERGG